MNLSADLPHSTSMNYKPTTIKASLSPCFYESSSFLALLQAKHCSSPSLHSNVSPSESPEDSGAPFPSLLLRLMQAPREQLLYSLYHITHYTNSLY